MAIEIEKSRIVHADSTETSDLTYGVALIDRLTKSVVGVLTPESDLDASKLMQSFGIALHELYILKKKLKQRLSELETKCREEERTFHLALSNLRDEVSRLHVKFNSLDTQVNLVSGKLVHLSDELDRKRLPRKRIADARASTLEFFKFFGAGGGTFAYVAVNSSGDEEQLIEAAMRIKNLTALCMELPNDENFLPAKQRITVACQQLEKELLEKFQQACINKDSDLKKRIADVLSTSTGNMACTAAIVEEALKGIDVHQLDFNAIATLMAETEKEILTLFPHPDPVVMKLLNTLFKSKIKPYLERRITPVENLHEHLTSLYNEYQNIEGLMQALSDKLTVVTDPVQLSGLFQELFNPYLSGYIQQETSWLNACLAQQLNDFYDSVQHKKRNINKLGPSDLSRDFKAMLGITVAEKDRTAYATSLLSEGISVNMIEDARNSLRRCQLLSDPVNRASNGYELFNILHKHLVKDHINYGVSIALQGLQVEDWENLNPDMVFFTVTNDASSIFQFFTTTVEESIKPLVGSNMKIVQEINSKRMASQQDLEMKINMGLERCSNLIIHHLQQFLPSDQRKAEFRANDSACQRTVSFFSEVINRIRQHLDGDNLNNILKDLGLRFKDAVIDHLNSFTFSVTAGLTAMQHVTAYRDVAKRLNDPTINGIFDVLLQLMNLMAIKPENVSQVIQDYLQLGIPKNILMNFIQLRQDYKSAKLHLYLK